MGSKLCDSGTKVRKKVKHPEQDLQKTIYKWFSLQYPLLYGCLFHVPNGGKRSVVEASIFKAMGTVSGIPDILFIYKGVLYAFELKADEGKLTDNQKYIHEQFKKQGVDVVIIRSLDSFIQNIKQIIK